MTIAGLLLGIINIGILVAALVLIGVIIKWILTLVEFPPPAEATKVFLLIVALIALYMIVALLFGMPSFRLLPQS
jgi:hypothetical protein